MKNKRVIVIDVVGLSPSHFRNMERMPNLESLKLQGTLHALKPVFPALTLPVQASLTTGAYPDRHGVVANGLYFPDNRQVAFWEQSSALVQSQRTWELLRELNPAHKTACLFLQNTLYASCEAIITPKPLHTEKGLVQWCYSKPVGFYEELSEKLGKFNLLHYWGPMASIESSRWIADAAIETMARQKPDLMYVYLPHMDYCSQRFGPDDPCIGENLALIDSEVGKIVRGVDDLGLREQTVILVLSEYVFSKVQGDIALNRRLRNYGLLEVRTIEGREYLDCELSPAFAMVDHQIAHLYIRPGYEKEVRRVLEQTDGIDLILDLEGKKRFRVDHPRSGDLVAVSAKNRWFSYYWWDDRSRAPDFADHVDIHRKPGYDPLELFLEPGTFEISRDTSLIKGSHGYPCLTEEDCAVMLISGDTGKGAEIPENPCIVDIQGIIQNILK